MAKVLVVDDSISVRKALERILKPKGVEVLPAESAKVGLSVLEHHRPTLIIADVVMPEIDGFEFCKMIKANPKLRSIPILLISGIVNPETKAQAREYKAVGIVKKPFKPDTLLYIVDLIFNKLKTKQSDEAQAQQEPKAGQPLPQDKKVVFNDAAFKEKLERLRLDANLEVLWLLNSKGEMLTQVGEVALNNSGTLGVQAQTLKKAVGDISEKLSLDNFQSVLIEYGKKCLLMQNVSAQYTIVGTLSDINTFSVARYVMRRKLSEFSETLP